MGKEYWLIKNIKTTGHRNPIQIIDRHWAFNLREAEKEFKFRNDFKKLLIKSDLCICESRKWFQ